MIPYDLQHITLMQIDIFFKCAELKNFTKAAEELRITPAMVSKKISALESALGFPLFCRQKNRVTLTAEGEALYAAWRSPIESMVYHAANIKENHNKSRTIEFSLWASTNPERFFVPLINAFSAEEELLFHLHLREDPGVLEDIVSGKLDVAFMPKFAERGIREMQSLDYFLAVPSPLYVALPADHPLAQKKTFSVEKLQGLTLLVSEGAMTWYMDMVKELCLEHGFTARIKMVEEQIFNTNYLCMRKNDAIITDKYFHAFASNALEYRELEDTESGLLMIFRKNAPTHVRHLLEFAWNFYKELR